MGLQIDRTEQLSGLGGSQFSDQGLNPNPWKQSPLTRTGSRLKHCTSMASCPSGSPRLRPQPSHLFLGPHADHCPLNSELTLGPGACTLAPSPTDLEPVVFPGRPTPELCPWAFLSQHQSWTNNQKKTWKPGAITFPSLWSNFFF